MQIEYIFFFNRSLEQFLYTTIESFSEMSQLQWTYKLYIYGMTDLLRDNCPDQIFHLIALPSTKVLWLKLCGCIRLGLMKSRAYSII